MYEQDVNPAIPFNLSKLVLMGAISLVLCMSFIMSIFAPFPIAFSSVVYGRSKGYGLALVTWAISLLLSIGVFGDMTIFFAYSMSMVVAVGISEIVLRGISPIRGMVKFGAGLVLALSFVLLFIVKGMGVDLRANLVEQIKSNKEIFELQKEKLKQAEGGTQEGTFEMMALLSQPEVLADEILKEAPSYFFIATFLVIWANLFLLLRSNRMIQKFVPANYTEKDLLNVKVPDHFIWGVIVGFLLVLWGGSLGTTYPIIGMNILKFLGIFYFFQGFGIYLAFLDFARIGGFFRTVLVMLTIFTAAQFIALVGLFDMFVNFRRFFKRNKNEGEQ